MEFWITKESESKYTVAHEFTPEEKPAVKLWEAKRGHKLENPKWFALQVSTSAEVGAAVVRCIEEIEKALADLRAQKGASDA